eukprot:TRINITY_DN1618_c1_g1_i6.p1 TRINITY_DN1618_c1_g1~~TRINITY_DN1618_c1_g1_i6.p1  ORF type:complete len:159 (-),score=32.75 TRINITY_DN1618_c1_g1_i6:396-839(-)
MEVAAAQHVFRSTLDWMLDYGIRPDLLLQMAETLFRVSEEDFDMIAAQGRALSLLGRYSQAAALQEQVLNHRKELLGDEHPDVAWSMNNLADSLWHLGRRQRALEVQEAAVCIISKCFDAQHPLVVRFTETRDLMKSQLAKAIVTND